MENQEYKIQMEKLKMRICRDVARRVFDKKHGKQQDVCLIPQIFDKCHQEKGNYLFGSYPGLYICCLIINLLT
jgi:hypothetical protein